MEHHLYGQLKSSCFEIFGDEKYGIFEPKVWLKDDIYWYWKGLVLNFSVMGNMIFFWVMKLMERWYLLVTEKFLFLTFRGWEIRSFFQPKNWWKDNIYMKRWSFWAFYDIPGPGKYGYLRSALLDNCFSNLFTDLEVCQVWFTKVFRKIKKILAKIWLFFTKLVAKRNIKSKIKFCRQSVS